VDTIVKGRAGQFKMPRLDAYAYFSKPYHVLPSGKGQKPYALLRDTLHKTGKVGLAKVVISTRQHFAALMPVGNGLVLNLLRWAQEVRSMDGLALPGADIKISARELQMAEMLVNDLAAEWSPDLFHDEFKEQLTALIDKKAKAGKSITLAGSPADETPREETAKILDLTEILKRSLGGRHASAAGKTAKAANDGKVTPLRSAAAKMAPSRVTASARTTGKRKAG
jgi:DNA end-binding protein Ku